MSDEKRQIELEAESVALGVERYRNNLEEQGHQSTTVGQKFLRATVPPTAELVSVFCQSALGGKAGPRHSAVAYLQQLEPTSAAMLSIRVALAAISQHRPLTTIAQNIGQAIKEHIEWMDLHEEQPGLTRTISERLKTAQNEHYRRAVARDAVRKRGRPKDWGPQVLIKLGLTMVDLMIEATGMFEVRHQQEGHNRTRTYLQGTPVAQQWLDSMHSRAELLDPIWMPMVVPPKRWTTPWDGGYITRRISVVKTRSKPYLEELKHQDVQHVYDAINAVQETAWAINTNVLDVLREAWKTRSQVGDLPPQDPEPLPAKPADIDSNEESLRMWKKAASLVHASNAKLQSKRLMVLRQINLAEKFRDEPALYFPHTLDWRGRMYPVPTDVTPQGDDVSKALLRFSEGKPLGESGGYWLAVHIANLYGVDKVSFDDRVKWTEEHSELIMDAAMDPLDGRRFWCEADDPWQALAASFEWLGFNIEGDSYVSHIPIGMDGSCNGLQNFSAMLRDPIGGAATNLLPQHKPADIYTEVAIVVREMLEETIKYTDDEYRRVLATKWLDTGIPRKLVKRPVMTLPYGATQYGMRGQLEKSAEELGLFQDDEDFYKGTVFLAKMVYEAIGRVVLAARSAMDWLQDVARLAAGEGLPVYWRTPDGFPVLQAYRKTIKSQVKAMVGGRVMRLKFVSDDDPINASRQALGIAPNYVHSMDASHLRATVHACVEHGITSLAMVHDSYGTHAANVDLMHVLLREAFIEQYSQPVLKHFGEQIGAQLSPSRQAEMPEVPPPGDLDLEDVRQSDFFFS